METETKSSESVEVPTQPRASKWRIVRRVMKYLTLNFLGAITLLTIVTWIRSYHHSDRVQGTLVGDQCFMVASSQGCVACVAFDTASPMKIPKPFEIDWAIKTYPLVHPMAYPNAEVIDENGKLKIGLIREVHYTYWSKKKITNPLPRGGSITYQGMTVFLKGGGLLIPHWVILFVCVTLFVLILYGRRFTLRAFMIWLTLVCVLLGIAMRIDSPTVQSNWQMLENE